MIREFPPRDRLPPSRSPTSGLPFPSSRLSPGSPRQPPGVTSRSSVPLSLSVSGERSKRRRRRREGERPGPGAPGTAGPSRARPAGRGLRGWRRARSGVLPTPPPPPRKAGGPGTRWGEEVPGAATQAGQLWNPAQDRAEGCRAAGRVPRARGAVHREGRGAGPAARPLRVLSAWPRPRGGRACGRLPVLRPAAACARRWARWRGGWVGEWRGWGDWGTLRVAARETNMASGARSTGDGRADWDWRLSAPSALPHFLPAVLCPPFTLL